MTLRFDSFFDKTPAKPGAPSIDAYGLPPGPAGYCLADLRCTPVRDGWRADGVYTESGVGLVLSGVFDYACEGRGNTTVPGAFVFANRDKEFSCQHLCADGNRRLVLFFAGDLLEAIADDLCLDSASFPTASAPPSPLTPVISGQMLRIARQDEDSDEAAAAIAQSALLSASGRSGQDTAPPADRQRIIAVVRHINASFNEPCTLGELASIAGMSQFRFARRFRAVTGESANQYVLNRRLSAAAAQLLATRRSVSEIAYEVGFNDLSYFYTRFKGAFGSAPGEWRRLRVSH
jgi:AraC family transcriptional regulator